jgi:predicted nucleic acid-binding protein
MAVLLDTNILLRLLQPRTQQAQSARSAIDRLRLQNHVLQITSQNLVEFWAVATRPASMNGLGYSVEEAMVELANFKRLFTLLPESPLQSEWERLVTTYRVSGKNSHDARLVAAMMVHGTRSILTFNVQDFTRYAGITVLDPHRII